MYVKNALALHWVEPMLVRTSLAVLMPFFFKDSLLGSRVCFAIFHDFFIPRCVSYVLHFFLRKKKNQENSCFFRNKEKDLNCFFFVLPSNCIFVMLIERCLFFNYLLCSSCYP